MDEGLSSIQSDLARRDDDISAMKETFSTLVEVVKRTEDEKIESEAAFASKKRRSDEKKNKKEEK